MRDLLDQILDPEQLTALVGRRAVASRIRLKPETSLIVGLSDPESGEPDGWARILWPSSRAKAEKTATRAERHGLRYFSRDLPDGLLLDTGELWADPRLGVALRAAARMGLLDGARELLRYNPFRRLIVRGEGETVRVAATNDPVALPLQRALGQAGVPVPERLDDGTFDRVSRLAYVGDTDLDPVTDPAAHRAAGAAVARLHAARPVLPDALTAAIADRATQVCAQGRAHARILGTLASELAVRIAALTSRVTEAWAPHADSTAALVHGDASPDQVLLDSASGRIWVTDLDRATLGSPALDLGSYLALSRDDDGAAFLAGYGSAAGDIPGEDVLRAGRARALLLTAMDPLRRARTDWQSQVSARLDDIDEVLS